MTIFQAEILVIFLKSQLQIEIARLNGLDHTAEHYVRDSMNKAITEIRRQISVLELSLGRIPEGETKISDEK